MRCLLEKRKIEIKKKKKREEEIEVSKSYTNNFCLKRRVCEEFGATLGIGGGWLTLPRVMCIWSAVDGFQCQ